MKDLFIYFLYQKDLMKDFENVIDHFKNAIDLDQQMLCLSITTS